MIEILKNKASLHQERLWFINEFEKKNLYESSPVYHNIPLILKIKKGLEFSILNEALYSILEKNDIFKTFVKKENDQLYQAFYNEPLAKNLIKEVDLLKMNQNVIETEILKPFDLNNDKLYRFKLFKENGIPKTLLLVFHHIVMDKASLFLLFRDLDILLNNIDQPTEIKSDTISFQYSYFSNWQYNLPKKYEIKLLNYWKKELKNLPKLNLPMNKKREKIHIYKSEIRIFDIPNFGNLDNLCNELYIKEESFYLFIYFYVLNIFTNSKDVCIGFLPIIRLQEKLENAYGPISNLIAIRYIFDEDNSIIDSLQQFDREFKQSLEHYAMPFDKLASLINPQVDMSRTVFFDFLFQFENENQIINSHTSDSFEIDNTNLGLGKYDINFLIQKRKEKSIGYLTYNKLYFEDSMISEFIDCYLNIFNSILNSDDLNKKLCKIGLLSESRLKDEISIEKVGYPKTTINELFFNAVYKNANNIAVELENQSLTYEELNEKSNKIANYLIKRGIDNKRVGLFFDQSVDSIVAILGVLKAGYTYVPISVNFPLNRQLFVIEDSQLTLLLTNKENLSFNVECLNSAETVFEGIESTDLNLAEANDTAYIIYTSGSTGVPKGVEVSHENVVRLFYNDSPKFQFTSDDVWTMFHSSSFDFSVWEMFGALLFGGKLIIIPYELARNTPKFIKVLIEKEVTILNQTPSAFYNLIENLKSNENLFFNLRTIIFGGEVLFPNKLQGWVEKYPEVQLINMYGITETTVHVTYQEIKEEHINSNISKIGKAIPTNFTLVLDEFMRIVPNYVLGELYVGGAGVSKGYINNESLNDNRFITSTYHLNERLYKSGDLVKREKDGTLIYIGRNDSQVQLRGYRIETNEIAINLMNLLGIEYAYVMVKRQGEDSVLVAYVKLDGEIDLQQIRTLLIKELPDYMIPNFFIKIDDIPLTNNGKIDEERLPDINKVKTVTNEVESPKGSTEVEVLDIWTSFFNHTEMGVTTNFFELGGNSLMAITLLSKIEDKFNVSLKVSDFFLDPTIRNISNIIGQSTKVDKPINKLVKAEEKEYYGASSLQKRMLLLNNLSEVGLSYNIYKLFKLKKGVDISRLEDSFQQFINRHEIFRTYFDYHGNDPIQIIAENYDFKIKVIELSETKNVDAEIKKQIEDFNLNQLPLFRCIYIKSGEDNFLLFNFHHIIADGITIGILEKEIVSVYNGHDVKLPTYQYKDFSEWQNQLLLNGELEGQKKFWMSKFKDSEIMRLNGIGDRLRPPIFNFEGAVYKFELDENLYDKIKDFIISKNITDYMFFQTVYGMLLSKYAAQDEFILGCTIFGRNNHELLSVSGCFLNMLPMLFNIQYEDTFLEILNKFKEESLLSFENQEYPFELIVADLNVKRDNSRNPLFDHVFVFHNFQHDEEIEEEDKKILEPVMVKSGTSKYDLSLYASVHERKVSLEFEYYTAIFESETIENLAIYYKNIIEEVIENPELKFKNINLINKEKEDEIIFDFNNNEHSFDSMKKLHELFELSVLKTPQKEAVFFGKDSITYSELNSRANKVAHYLLELDTNNTKIRSIYVGVYLNRTIDYIISILGILKAGKAYVPIDVGFPLDRVKYIINNTQLNIILSSSEYIKTLNNLQWECPKFLVFNCLDSDNVWDITENVKNEKMTPELWDYVSENATNDIDRGGWKSSYTGVAFSEPEMNEYVENTKNALLPLIQPDDRVLEIGIGSGFTLFELAPKVNEYFGIDLSPNVIEKVQEKVNLKNLENVQLETLFAHEIDKIEGKKFSVIILNSVIQSFHGHNYLRQVLKKCIDLLDDQGMVFFGDLLDQSLKGAFMQSLVDFRKTQSKKDAMKVKLDWNSELFISREFLQDLPNQFGSISGIETFEKTKKIRNELTEYRYDAVLRINKLENNKSVNFLKYQHDYSKISNQPDSNIALSTLHSNSDIAYIIHTSGTTGHPKGVVVEHKPVINLIEWVNKTYNVNEEDKLLFTTSFNFDLSVYDVFGILASGGSIYYTSEDEIREPNVLAKLIASEGITFWDSAPAMLDILVDELSKISSVITKLRLIFLSGDWIRVSMILKLKEILKECQIIGLGGATEATIWSNFYEITDEVDGTWKSIPYGKPIQNAKYYILNDDARPCPVGVPGKLFIGGSCLAKEYLNDKTLTDSKFIENPFVTHERIYDTGDIARWLPNKEMEFLGRKDNQLKIRGLRVEKGEISSNLLLMDGMQKCLVVDKKDKLNNVSLLVYYTSDVEYDKETLIRNLKSKIPSYMIPAFYMRLDEFPVTSNGKIDYKNLPDIKDQIDKEKQIIKPSNNTEKLILKVWKDILDEKQISVFDNFFDVGGNSLHLIKVSQKLKEVLDTDIPVSLLFEYPTIRSLSQNFNQEVTEIIKESRKENIASGKKKALQQKEKRKK